MLVVVAVSELDIAIVGVIDMPLDPALKRFVMTRAPRKSRDKYRPENR